MAAKKIISLDIGGTNTRAALINENYQIEKVIIHPTVAGSLDGFLFSVSSIIRDLQPDLSTCLAISGGVPGRVRVDGYIEALPNIHIEKIPLSDYLKKQFGLPVYIKNDAEVACLAEAVAGPYKSYKSLYFITISTGVGGALAIDGQLRNSSYEAGHTMTELHGEYHEFEHMASGTYLVRLAAMKGVQIAGPKEFFEAVKERHPTVLPIYQDWIALFSSFIKMMQDAFQPQAFVLTGGVMKSSDVFFDDLKNACPGSKLFKCYYEQEAGLIGAAVYGFQMSKK